MRKRVLPPEDTPSANLSAAAAVGCSTPPSTPRNTVTATGAAIRPTIGGSGNTAKCAVRIWSASAAVKNSRPNVQMPDIAATPADKKSIENVLQMLQVLKMSTSFFVPSQGLLKIRCRHPALDFTRILPANFAIEIRSIRKTPSSSLSAKAVKPPIPLLLSVTQRPMAARFFPLSMLSAVPSPANLMQCSTPGQVLKSPLQQQKPTAASLPCFICLP